MQQANKQYIVREAKHEVKCEAINALARTIALNPKIKTFKCYVIKLVLLHNKSIYVTSLSSISI